MQSTHRISRTRRVILIVLICVLLLTACQPGKVVGKTIRQVQYEQGGVTLVETHYILIMEGCQLVEGVERCTQYEVKVSKATYDKTEAP
jgi:predicted small secreted protein